MFVKYWRTIIEMACRKAIDLAQGLIFIALIVIGLTISIFPTFSATNQISIVLDAISSWKGLAFILISVVIVRLLTAPHYIWSDQNDKITKMEEDLRPKIKLSFHPKEEGIVREKLALKQNGQILGEGFYIRIRVECVSSLIVNHCMAFLTNLHKEKADGLSTEPISLPHGILLRNEEHFTVYPKVISTVDFALTKSFDNKLIVPHAVWPSNLASIFDQTGTYRFTIRVSDEHGIGDEITIAVGWPGRWDKVEAHQVPKL